MFVGDGYKMFWGKAIFEAPNNHIMHALHEIPGWVGWMPFVAMAAGFALSYTYYIHAPWLPEGTARAFRPLYLFLLNMWYFDELYDWLFVRPARALGIFLWRKGDGAVIDGAIDGTATRVLATANSVGRLQTDFIYHYAFAMLIGLAALITWFMFGTGGIR
jgi:NADH-quinone oxidoreductase subunit L